MKQALLLLLLIAAVFVIIDLSYGHQIAFSVAFGSISVMALMISVTFLWLWRRRETPLALGMSFSWAGAASVLGWWWLFHVLEQPQAMQTSSAMLVFLSLYFVGAVQHFIVMQRSLNGSVLIMAMPVLLAIGLAGIIALGL